MRADHTDEAADEEDDALFARPNRDPARDRRPARRDRSDYDADWSRLDRDREGERPRGGFSKDRNKTEVEPKGEIRGDHKARDQAKEKSHGGFWKGRGGERDETEEKESGGFWKSRDERKEPQFNARGDEDADRGLWWRRGKTRDRDEDDDRLFVRPDDGENRAARGDRRERDDHRSDRDQSDYSEDDNRRFADDENAGAYRDQPHGATIVDADFEDIENDGEYGAERGFGRRARAVRRRATALARLDDLDPVAERVFNDEFFAALRVQPKELERALRKARRRAESREKNRMTPLRALGWSAWIGLVAATCFVGYTYRDDIVAKWPNTAGAYAIVGIDAKPNGLTIESVTHRLAMSTSGPTIEIIGNLKNNGGETVTPPLMQAEALGPKGELLSRWTFAVDADRVAQGASASFMTRAPAPEGVVEVSLSFAPEKASRPGLGDLLTRQD